jgi:hypothetical protein
LGEAVIETAAPGACHVGEDAVEGHAAVFVGVEAFVQHLAKEAPVLRDPFAQHSDCRHEAFRSCLA